VVCRRHKRLRHPRVSVIAFIGSVFSPWYRWSGRKDPENHVCINVATYGPGGRFTMTDRGRAALRQSEERLRGRALLDALGGRPAGDRHRRMSARRRWSRPRARTITRHALGADARRIAADEDGAHVWRPFAPVADIEVDLDAKGWQWSGHGYFDANFGTRALEEDFSFWTWGRFPFPGRRACFYDAVRLDGTRIWPLASHFDARGRGR
jgi:carotenoid 1,2-hydratase